MATAIARAGRLALIIPLLFGKRQRRWRCRWPKRDVNMQVQSVGAYIPSLIWEEAGAMAMAKVGCQRAS